MASRADVIAITDLKADAAELLRSIAEEERTVTVTQNGEPRAVVMAISTYERWRAALALLKLVNHSEHSISAGAVVTQDEAFRRAEAAIARVQGDGTRTLAGGLGRRRGAGPRSGCVPNCRRQPRGRWRLAEKAPSERRIPVHS